MLTCFWVIWIFIWMTLQGFFLVCLTNLQPNIYNTVTTIYEQKKCKKLKKTGTFSHFVQHN